MRRIQGMTGLALLVVALTGGVPWSWAQPYPAVGALPGESAPVGPPLASPPPGESAPAVPPFLAPEAPATAPTPPLPGEDKAAAPAAEEENSNGRQEPAVSVEWNGPPLARAGRPSDYTLVVRNACNMAVRQVKVHVILPVGLTIMSTEPKALPDDNGLSWDLGTLETKQERNLNLRVVPNGKNDLDCQTSVTFSGSSTMKIRVCEPALVLKVTAPEKVLLGDLANLVMTVTNSGNGPADLVKIHALVSEGLDSNRGKTVDFDIGTLAAGESRSVQLVCGTKTGGPQSCDAVAEAEGNLKSPEDKATVNVILPRLNLEATGPKLRYLNRKGTYSFKVINPGDAPATNVTVRDVIPNGFKFLSASDGGRYDISTRTVSWFVTDVGPGQAREVKLEVEAVLAGDFQHKASAQAARGLQVDGEVATRVEGVTAILLEVADTEDPIEVGAETTYELRITNTGSKAETDIKLLCTIPDKMQFKTAQGPSHFQEQGKEIVFEPLPRLAPKAEAIYRVSVKGIAAGDVRFKAQLSSTNLQEPVIQTESTRIYDDGGTPNR